MACPQSGPSKGAQLVLPSSFGHKGKTHRAPTRKGCPRKISDNMEKRREEEQIHVVPTSLRASTAYGHRP